MAYQALYRKWRPQTFEQVLGQTATVKTLRRQIEAGRIAHAYLFCGSRGTGKTSSAKIMARRRVEILIDHIEHGGHACHEAVPYALQQRESTRRIDDI